MFEMLTEREGRKAEVEGKLARLRTRMAAANIEVIHLTQNANLAWLTAGAATYINEATDTSPVSLLVTPDKAYVLSDTIETPRLRDEQGLESLGFEIVSEKWYDRGHALLNLAANRRGMQDAGGGATIMKELRSTLVPEEIERLRYAGQLAADAMDEVVRLVRPGDSEYLLASRMTQAARTRGGVSIVNLVASDERIFRYRHPLPTRKLVQNYAMLVMCFRFEGLILSLTRLVYFGVMPAELKAKKDACARVDARLILGTQAGRTFAQLFEIARTGYAQEGFPEAIEEHHQGGSAGYLPREIVAAPTLQTPISVNQAFAWNPSIQGVKSEDTILLTADGVEVLTQIPSFPTIPIKIGDQVIERPDILQS